jgi:hypothetical protein
MLRQERSTGCSRSILGQQNPPLGSGEFSKEVSCELEKDYPIEKEKYDSHKEKHLTKTRK